MNDYKSVSEDLPTPAPIPPDQDDISEGAESVDEGQHALSGDIPGAGVSSVSGDLVGESEGHVQEQPADEGVEGLAPVESAPAHPDADSRFQTPRQRRKQERQKR